MLSKLGIIRRTMDTCVIRQHVNWDKLPYEVIDAAAVRENPALPFELVQQVVNDMRDGKIAVKKTFPNGTPSLLEIYQVAFNRQMGSI